MRKRRRGMYMRDVQVGDRVKYQNQVATVKSIRGNEAEIAIGRDVVIAVLTSQLVKLEVPIVEGDPQDSTNRSNRLNS